MTRLWVFDAYGTLFDPQTLSSLLEGRFPGRGDALARAWRETQLRYTWLRTLMDRWAPFDEVTADALRYSVLSEGEHLDPGFVEDALAAYRTLPAYPEVGDALARLDERAVILSNGTRAMLEAASRAAGIESCFEAILGSDDARVYKPHPRLYGLVAERLSVSPGQVRFVSGNAWDCAGAAAVGFEVVRVARADGPDEQLGVPRPVRTVPDLEALLEL